MSNRLGHHRPLRAGIAITPSGGMPGMGTLGAVARRNLDINNTKVLGDPRARRQHTELPLRGD